MQRLGPTKKKKGKREEVSVLIVSATGLSLCTEQRVDFVQEMGDWSVKADHPQRSQFHPTNLFLSLNLWCKDLVPQKEKEKEKQWVCWLFWPLDCLYALNREWTLYKRWVTDQWRLITHKGVSFTQQISSLALICDAKTWSHKKKGKGKAVSVLIVSATGLSLCTEQRVDFVQEMGD